MTQGMGQVRSDDRKRDRLKVSGRKAGSVLGSCKVDGRSTVALRWKAVRNAILADVGPGPHSTAVVLLAERAATVTVRIERIDAELIAGLDVDETNLDRLNGELRRTLGALGLADHRKPWRAEAGSKKAVKALKGAPGRDALAEAMLRGPK